MALVRSNPTMPWRPSQEPWSPVAGMEALRAEMDHPVQRVSWDHAVLGHSGVPVVSPG